MQNDWVTLANDFEILFYFARSASGRLFAGKSKSKLAAKTAQKVDKCNFCEKLDFLTFCPERQEVLFSKIDNFANCFGLLEFSTL